MSKFFHQGSSIGDQDVSDFLENILQSFTQYSIIGMGVNGTIQLWNEGGRLLYGYEAEDVVDSANISILHVVEDVASGLLAEMLRADPRERAMGW